MSRAARYALLDLVTALRRVIEDLPPNERKELAFKLERQGAAPVTPAALAH